MVVLTWQYGRRGFNLARNNIPTRHPCGTPRLQNLEKRIAPSDLTGLSSIMLCPKYK